MKKIVFSIASIYLVCCLVWILPAYSTSPKFYEHRYAATEKEKVIIKDVYGHMTTEVAITLWSFIGMYIALVAMMFCDTRKPKKPGTS